MTLKALDILKKGFSKFMKTIKAHRDELNTKLKPFRQQMSTPVTNNAFSRHWNQLPIMTVRPARQKREGHCQDTKRVGR